MLGTATHNRTLLRKAPPPGGDDPAHPGGACAPAAKKADPAPDAAEEERPEDAILCSACGNAVTSMDQRTVAGGKHCHVFCNPHGLVFELGCFLAAPGCAPSGPPSMEFTWFPGHAWRVAVCRSCAAHLGWRFEAPGGSAFHGLILDRLAGGGTPPGH
jgi:hypothetical protein